MTLGVAGPGRDGAGRRRPGPQRCHAVPVLSVAGLFLTLYKKEAIFTIDSEGG